MFSYLDFCCYFEANGQNHTHFRPIQVLTRENKNTMAWHFLTFRSLSSKLEFLYLPWSFGVRRVIAHFLVMFNAWTSQRLLKLTIVLIWKTPTCLKFGKTSNRAGENLPQRKLWVWAANAERCTLWAKNLISPNFGERVLLRVRTKHGPGVHGPPVMDWVRDMIISYEKIEEIPVTSWFNFLLALNLWKMIFF